MVFIFFIYSAFTIYFYNYFWTPEGDYDLNQYIGWILLLVLIMLHGPGKLSVDHWLRKRHIHHLKKRPKEI